MWWFWWWLLIALFFLVLPLSYGWGYRGWGPPYPRGRRATPAERRAAAEEASVEEEATWGALAIFIWVMLAIVFAWLIVGLLTV